MQSKPIDKTAAPINPLYDTWGGKKDAGSWGLTPLFDFASLPTPEVNAWFAKSVADTLDAFSSLARAWQVSFGSLYRDDVEPVWLEWKPEDSYEEYIENILKAIREYSAPIYSLTLKVDLFVFVRTQESPDQPIRAWVRYLGEFLIWGGPENPEPDLCFNVAHTLFHPFSYDGDDNSELYSLNQPLLENALRRWEERFGPICEVQGLLAGIYEYGFLPEEQGDAESTN